MSKNNKPRGQEDRVVLDVAAIAEDIGTLKLIPRDHQTDRALAARTRPKAGVAAASLKGLPGVGCESYFRFRKEGIIELGIHLHLFDDGLLRRNGSIPESLRRMTELLVLNAA